MKPKKMTVTQQRDYYKSNLETALDAHNRMRQSNEMLNNKINDLNNQIEWYKSVISAFVRFIK